jgi:hypothetical protein
MILVIDGVLDKTKHLREELFSEKEKFAPHKFEACAEVPYIRFWDHPDVITALRLTHGGKELDIKASYLRSDLDRAPPSQACRTHQKVAEWTALTWINDSQSFRDTRGAVMFWRHTDTNLREYFHEKFAPEVWDGIQRDTENPEKWTTDTLVAPWKGRTVVFRNTRFWSFWPQAGWGNELRKGRLTYIVHYNVVSP